jgi:hypothetical protein
VLEVSFEGREREREREREFLFFLSLDSCPCHDAIVIAESSVQFSSVQFSSLHFTSVVDVGLHSFIKKSALT